MYLNHYSYILVQLTQYDSQQNSVITPASPLTQAFAQTTSPRPDMGGYLTASSRTHDHHLYHSAHSGTSPTRTLWTWNATGLFTVILIKYYFKVKHFYKQILLLKTQQHPE